MSRRLQSRTMFAVVIVALLGLIGVSKTDGAGASVSITVFARDGSALGGTLVYSYANGVKLDEAVSDRSGRCEVRIPSEGEFDLVFGGGGIQPSVIEKLYGGSQQTLRKTVLRDQETDAQARAALAYSVEYIRNRVDSADAQFLLEGLERRRFR